MASDPRTPKRTFLLRPGSLGRSTSLWWLVPLGVVWAGVAGALAFLGTEEPSVLTLRTSLWILFATSVFTAAWGAVVVFTQREADTESGSDTLDVRGRHAFWRARTVAWDVTAIGVAGIGLGTLLLIGPARILPAAYVPLVELGVLVLTLALLATFSRYAAMAFSTDSKGVVQKLEQIAMSESTARDRDREQLKEAFHQEIERLVSKVSEQITSTEVGLSRITVALSGVANAVEQHRSVGEEARRAAEQAAHEIEQRLNELRAVEEQRQTAASGAAIDRRRRISPRIEVAVRIEGTLLHSVWVDVRNRGFDGHGLELLADLSTGGRRRFTAAGLASMAVVSYRLGDVGQLPMAATLTIDGTIADVDGERRGFRAPPIQYGRKTGFLGLTRAIGVNPAGWQLAPETSRPALAVSASIAD